MQMLGGRGENAGDAPADSSGFSQAPAVPRRQSQQPRPAAPAAAPASNLSDMDDDIPF
jgi:single-strand DNA-binding protein